VVEIDEQRPNERAKRTDERKNAKQKLGGEGGVKRKETLLSLSGKKNKLQTEISHPPPSLLQRGSKRRMPKHSPPSPPHHHHAQLEERGISQRA
jgi:hypothetical protein